MDKIIEVKPNLANGAYGVTDATVEISVCRRGIGGIVGRHSADVYAVSDAIGAEADLVRFLARIWLKIFIKIKFYTIEHD